jgi:hypothetical protein
VKIMEDESQFSCARFVLPVVRWRPGCRRSCCPAA